MKNTLFFLFVTATTLIICVTVIPNLLKKRLYPEFWVSIVALGLSLLISFSKVFDFSVPNPSDLILWIYSPLKGLIRGLLKQG